MSTVTSRIDYSLAPRTHRDLLIRSNDVRVLPGGIRRSGVTRLAASSSAPRLVVLWNHPVAKAVSSFFISFYTIIRHEFKSLNSNQKWIMIGAFVLGVKLGQSSSSLVLRSFKNAVDIPTTFFGPQAPLLTGTAVCVSDGDTLRFLHRPTVFHASSLGKNQKLSEHTLPVRLCAIDTPETPKFGKPGQPFGEDAKKKLQSLVENRTIQVRLLTKDQYGRAVGQVYMPRRIPRIPFFPKQGVEEIMLKAGLAEVYQGMGAVYGTKGKDAYLILEEQARKAKKGIWSQAKRESAAEYKKRTKE
jgi:micrococcal nuclease